MWWSTPVTLVNARVVGADGRLHDTFRVSRGRVDGLDVAPARGDIVIDAEGGLVLPGLVNAHDHLELNAQPRLKWRARYRNVSEWIADFQPRFRTDARLAIIRPDTLDERCWIGGLKNLLAGVTTVCHHNPLHPHLLGRFPVRVVRRFGFSHSLQIDRDDVVRSFRRTPWDWPWIVHAAEGVDEQAQREARALEIRGCLAANTVLVHGVGLTPGAAARVIAAGAGLVWCPSSNRFLFGTTADVRAFDDAGRLALGSDSRLSGDGDLLDELRAAHDTRQVSAEGLLRSVTSGAARLLRLPDAGRLREGAPADLVVIGRGVEDPFHALVTSARLDVRLVMVGGEARIGEPGMEPVFRAVRTTPVPARLDGAARLVAPWIGRRMARQGLREPGFEVDA